MFLVFCKNYYFNHKLVRNVLCNSTISFHWNITGKPYKVLIRRTYFRRHWGRKQICLPVTLNTALLKCCCRIVQAFLSKNIKYQKNAWTAARLRLMWFIFAKRQTLIETSAWKCSKAMFKINTTYLCLRGRTDEPIKMCPLVWKCWKLQMFPAFDH